MGKKSKSQLNKMENSVSKHTLGSSKNRKRRKNKTKKIKKLFDQLRNESDVSTSSTSNITVVELDDTVVEMPKTSIENDANLVVIDDEDIVESGTENIPMHSTPLPCRSNPIQDTHISPVNLDLSSNLNDDIINLTREINRDSYLTIDLTNETINSTNETQMNTVIDLINNSKDHRSLTSLDSMSGDSDVTILNTKRKNKNELKKFANGIAKMNSSERGKLLELIANKIFNGCNTLSLNGSTNSRKNGVIGATNKVEDVYIKEVILGKPASRNSIGSNIYNPEKDASNKTGPRMIVIDGSNVAMQHTKGRIFSVKGLKICIDYFLQRGHVVKAFVPHFRCKYGKSTDGKLLDSLERQGHVVYTPSREVQGRMITSYDDRYIIQCAAEFDGVIVSGDNYRDLMNENPRWRFIIENRLLPFTWVGDMIMFPKDPLGRNGPTLHDFLKHPG
ncbi:uncharacterized protein LOC121727725 isoform X2 [Aricia agestis]|uniref:uncharacterized protein LOC121727725 isoform X2 n=1 Tax=Aricia agestis TaxID=91739 RepID=UPI001C20238A|nr:uncharacterized protein LOC121727725 isoform X2 [Aricia agestis]